MRRLLFHDRPAMALDGGGEKVYPIQIISLVLGIISISLGVPVAIRNLHDQRVNRDFWKSFPEKSQELPCKNRKDLEGHVPSEEELAQSIAGRCLLEK